jgi:hypothetical protein
VFFCIIKSVVKHNTGAKEKYAPRSVNVESWDVAGPFTKLGTAERAAASVLSRHTCLTAQVYSQAGLAEYIHKDVCDYQLARKVRALFESAGSAA